MSDNPKTAAKRYVQALRQGGLRITSQRRAVCDYLAHTRSHPTPTEVYAHVVREHPEISRATVYNTLNALRDLGAILEISVGGNHTHYETDPSPHTNLICLGCGRVIDYDGDVALDDLYGVVRDKTGFQTVSAQVQVVGFCADCQARKRAEIRQQLRERRTDGP